MKKIKGIYFVQFEDGIKIGISNNILDRLDVYRTPWNKKINRIFFMSHPNPIYIENFLKKEFKHYTYNSPEFFINLGMYKLINEAWRNRLIRKAEQFIEVKNVNLYELMGNKIVKIYESPIRIKGKWFIKGTNQEVSFNHDIYNFCKTYIQCGRETLNLTNTEK